MFSSLLLGRAPCFIQRQTNFTTCKIRVETQQESGLKCSITEVYSTVSKTLWRQRGCYVIWNDQRFTSLQQKGWTNVKTRGIYWSPPGHDCACAARRRRYTTENTQSYQCGGGV